jgi:hypothetical protein
VVVQGGNPVLSGTQAAPNVEIRSDPALITHSYEQISKITYRLDREAIVTVKLLTPPAQGSVQEVQTLVNAARQQARDGAGRPIDHTVTYLGYGTATGESNEILSPVEGPYSFVIEARDPDEPMLTTTYRGVLSIRK